MFNLAYTNLHYVYTSCITYMCVAHVLLQPNFSVLREFFLNYHFTWDSHARGPVIRNRQQLCKKHERHLQQRQGSLLRNL